MPLQNASVRHARAAVFDTKTKSEASVAASIATQNVFIELAEVFPAGYKP